MSCGQSSQVNCFCWNVQSLVNKVHDVISVMVDKEIGIGCFTETWFSSLSNSTTAIIKDAGFDIVHCYREKRGGGLQSFGILV